MKSGDFKLLKLNMKHFDYIVVGLGIAGICFCEELEKHNKSFITIDSGQEGATAKSGGVFNPTVLKRFNAAWNASEFYPVAITFYQKLSEKLNLEIFKEMSILRIFRSVEEQNNWSVASDKRELQQFLSSRFLQNNNPSIQASLGFGEVLGTARINTTSLLTAYRSYLKGDDKLLLEEFRFEKMQIELNKVIYGNISTDKVVFCDGSAAIRNPFFPTNGIIPNKGEYLVIKAPELNLKVLLKGSLYVIPLGDSLYKVGATFGSDDFSTNPTVEAREEIISKLKTMISCPFEVVRHTVGIRPTTRDRKPLLGSRPENSQLAFFNGLGSRGFTMAPLLSEILYKNISMGNPVPPEMDINRIKN